MRTVTLNPSSAPETLVLGIRGEKAVSEVVFDYSAWEEEFGAGVVTLLVKRSKDVNPYPVVLDIDTEAHTATWTVSQTDVRYKGRGEVEWLYYIDEQIAKTSVFRTFVERDIGEDLGEAPDPYESWLDTLTQLGAEVQTNADNAERSAERAESAATEAEEAVAVNLTVEVRHTNGGYLVVTPPNADDLNTIINTNRIGICRVIMFEGVGSIGTDIGRLLLTAYSSTTAAEFIGYTLNGSFARLKMSTVLGRKTWAYILYSFVTEDTLNDNIQAVNERIGEVASTGVPSGGSAGQVLVKKTDTDYDTEWVEQSGGGSDYSDLENKPQIGGTTLVGNKTLPELGIEPTAFVVNVTQNGSSYTADHTYNEINAARLAGKRIVAVLSFVVYQFYGMVEHTFVFCSIDESKVKVISFPYRASITYTETDLDPSVVYVTYGAEARETIYNALQAHKAVICVCDDISPNGTLYLPISSCGSDPPSQYFSCMFSMIDDQQGELHFYNVTYWNGSWGVADYTISTS